MKTYIYRIILFFIPLCFSVVLLLLYLKHNHQFLPSSMYYYKDFNDAFQEKNMHVIALGNSKLLSAIDKTVLEENNQHKVAVLGYSSANLSVSKLTLESYINNCSTLPETVLLEVSWFTFNTKRTHLHNIVGELFIQDPYLWRNYFDYRDDLADDFKRAFIKTISIDAKIKKANPQISYAVKIAKNNSPDTINYKFNLKKFEVIFPDHIAGVDSKLLKDYNTIVSLCVDNNIDLILFTAPEDETYSKLQKDVNIIKSIFQKSENDYNNVYYLDYSFRGEFWDKNHEKWLKDSHHVNERHMFTEVLLKDIKSNTYNSTFNQ